MDENKIEEQNNNKKISKIKFQKMYRYDLDKKTNNNYLNG